MSDTTTESGGCLCGAVRYEFQRDQVVSAHHCYCRDCQRSTGGGFTTFCVVPESAFKAVKGTPKAYEVAGESGGKVNRLFCGDCGSPVWSNVSVMPGVLFVKAGSLDDAAWLTIQSSFWGGSSQPWTLKDEGHQVFEANPG